MREKACKPASSLTSSLSTIREMRGEASPFAHEQKHILRTINPAGMIDTDAWKMVDEAVRIGDSLVVVDGEEDLLTLVAILASPSAISCCLRATQTRNSDGSGSGGNEKRNTGNS